MTKKTPEQRIAELDQKRAKVEKKLKIEKEAITRAKRREQAKILNQNRKNDTRRKILIGAMRFDEIHLMSEDNQSHEKRRLKEQMNRYLKRDSDRNLFGLQPLVENTID
jgi:alpha-D-ribose 1-methylphosphonate 5-triphosphate diphosphatase PhnM